MQPSLAIQGSTSERGTTGFYGSYVNPLWSFFNTYFKQMYGEDFGFGGKVGCQLSNRPISHVLEQIIQYVDGVFFLSEWMSNSKEKGDQERLKSTIKGNDSFKNFDKAILFIPLVVEHYLGGRHIVLLSCIKQKDKVVFVYRDSQGTSIEGNAPYKCSYGKQFFKNEIEYIKTWVIEKILEKNHETFEWEDISFNTTDEIPLQTDVHSCGLHTIQYIFFLLKKYSFLEEEKIEKDAAFKELFEAAFNFKGDLESEKAFRKAIVTTLPKVPQESVDKWIEMTEKGLLPEDIKNGF